MTGKKPGIIRAIGQNGVSDESENNGGDPFENQKPPPASKAQPVHMIQNEDREGCRNDSVYGVAEQQERDRSRLFALGNPIRQVQNDSRVITSFREPEQEARHIQLIHVPRESSQ